MSEQVAQVGKTRITLVKGDITKQNTDVIVNAANSGLAGGGGVDGAIHRAGGPAIMEECRKIRNAQGKCDAGKAVITSGGNLPAKWVVHAVGPIWNGGTDGEEKLLAGAYSSSLELALNCGARSVSFPSISTGAYRYPVKPAALVALNAVQEFLETHPDRFDDVCFVLFDTHTYDVYKKAAEP